MLCRCAPGTLRHKRPGDLATPRFSVLSTALRDNALISRMRNSHPAAHLLPAAHQRGEDAEGRDAGADDKGSVKGGGKSVLQSSNYSISCWREAYISRQDSARQRAAKAGKDS